jgi:hypothetical protein
MEDEGHNVKDVVANLSLNTIKGDLYAQNVVASLFVAMEDKDHHV